MDGNGLPQVIQETVLTDVQDFIPCTISEELLLSTFIFSRTDFPDTYHVDVLCESREFNPHPERLSFQSLFPTVKV